MHSEEAVDDVSGGAGRTSQTSPRQARTDSHPDLEIRRMQAPRPESLGERCAGTIDARTERPA